MKNSRMKTLKIRVNPSIDDDKKAIDAVLEEITRDVKDLLVLYKESGWDIELLEK